MDLSNNYSELITDENVPLLRLRFLRIGLSSQPHQEARTLTRGRALRTTNVLRWSDSKSDPVEVLDTLLLPHDSVAIAVAV